MDKQRKFILHWLDGKKEELVAPDVVGQSQMQILANAMNQAGIGNGALRALDYWEEITTDSDRDKPVIPG